MLHFTEIYLYNEFMKNFVKYKKTSTEIKELFIELLKEKPVEKITIKEICETLSINRSTFYRHYEDIYFLFKEVENDLINKLIVVYENIANTDISSIDTMKSILNFIKENKEIYSILMIYQRDVDLWEKVNHLSVDLFLLKIYQKYPNYKKCNQNELRQTVQFITSGFYALYKNWLLDNCKEDIELLAIRLSSLSDTCIEKTIK